jgi:hypothetical protein
MGFLQQFHLVIKYKKGVFNKVADMLSRPIVSASVILKQSPIMHESYVEQYALDDTLRMCMKLCATLTMLKNWIIICIIISCIILASCVFHRERESTS